MHFRTVRPLEQLTGAFWKMEEMQWVLFTQGCKTYKKMHNSLTFPNKEMRVTSFGLLNLNGGCMSPIVNHCQLQWHDPQSCIYCLSLNDSGQVLESHDVCSGPYLVLALADMFQCSCQLVQFSNGCLLGKELGGFDCSLIICHCC